MFLKESRWYLYCFFVVLGLAVARPAAAITVQGDVSTNTRWTTAMSPVILSGDVTVKVGVTLTIDPGVVVQAAASDVLSTGADSSRVEINVQGVLIAIGTSGNPIVFKGSSSSAGTWYGIRILSGGSATLTHATVQYGRYCIDNYNVVALNNIQINNCSTYGVYARSGTTTISQGKIFGNNYGVFISGGKNKIADAVIYKNSSYGVYASYSSSATTVEVTRCTIAYNSNYGVYVYRSSSSSGAFILKDSIVVRNASTNYEVYSSRYGITCSNNLIWDTSGNTIYNRYSPSCAADVNYNPLFVDENKDDYRIYNRSPARKAGPGGIDIGAFAWTTHTTSTLHGKLLKDLTLPAGTHTLTGDLIVGKGVTLTLSPGAVLRVQTTDDMAGGQDRSRIELVVEGSLVAKGNTSGQTVSFRSTSTSTSTSLWYGIQVMSGAIADIQVASLSNARYGLDVYGTAMLDSVDISYCQYGLYIRGGSVNMDGSKLHHNQYGAYITNGKTKISYTQIYRNTSYGVYASYSSSTVTVEIDHCTIAYNSNYGIYSYRSSSSSGAFILKDSIVVRNASTNYEVYNSRYGVTCSNNLIWDTSGNTIYNQYSPSCSASVDNNPLFVDENKDDYRIYDRSPARKAGSGGTDLGALPWKNGPVTTRLHGKLTQDLTLPAGQHTVYGDLIVGQGITLTLSPGATLVFPTSDDMAGGADRARIELIIEGQLVAKGTSSQKITFRSTSSSTSNNLWYGIRVLAGSKVTLQNVDLLNARYGLDVYGTATLDTVDISRTQYALYVRDGNLNLKAGKLHHNQYGVYISNGKTKISYSLIYRNTSYGVYASYSPSTVTVEIDHCTIAYNSSYGIYSYRSSSSSGAFTLKDSIVVRNGGTNYEVYNSRYGINCSNNLIWDVSGNMIYNRYSPSCAASINYNPLFVDENKDDYRIYDRSPARGAGSGGSDVGALDWANNGKQTTTVLHGRLTTNTVLPAGTHKLMGDLIVAKGVTLTLAKGVILEAKPTDDMYGGVDTARAEIVVEGKLVAQGTDPTKPIQLKSEGTTTATNRWYGVRVVAGGAVEMQYVEFRSGRYCLETYGTVTLRDVDIAYCGSYGLYVRDGNTTYERGKLYRNSSYAVYLVGGVSKLSFLQIYRNSSYGLAASYSASNVSVLVDHCTIAYNSSYGVYVHRSSSSSGTFTLQNSIIVKNSGSSYEVYVSSYGPVCKNNLIWDSSGSTIRNRYSPSCSAYVNGDPLFKGAAQDDYNIDIQSPARKKATDQTDLGALPYLPALVSIQIKPALGTVEVGKTVQFSATGIDAQGGIRTGLIITWKLVGGGGTLSSSGLFTAGTKAGTFFSTIEASAKGIQGYASVKVTPGAITKLTVTPNPGKIPPQRTIQFSATGQDQYGNLASNLNVTWKLVNGGGTISPTGLVTAQAQNGTFTNTVEASLGNLKGYATLVVDSSIPVVTSVTISPAQAALKFGEQKSFQAVAKDQNGKVMTGLSFTWSAPAGGGTVVTTSQTQADFVAGQKAGTFSLVAETAGVKGTASIQITDPNAGVLGNISISPSFLTLKVGQSQQFQAQGYDKNGKTMSITPTWSTNGGTIDSKGLFKAGAATGTYSVTATVGAISGSATVQIAAGNPPTTPVLQSPADKAEVNTTQPTLTLTNSTDPDKDKLSYDFFVATDAQFTTVVAQGTVPETPNTTSWKVAQPLQEDTIYYWRARATDSVLRSGWSVERTFRVNATNNAPTAPQRSAPPDGGQVTDKQPTLVVNNAKDPEGKTLTYKFEIASDAAMNNVLATSNAIPEGSGSTSWKVSATLKNKTTYYWRAWAIDDQGLAGAKMATASFVTAWPNSPPTAPNPKAPADQGTVSASAATLEVDNATDPDSDTLTYHFQISEDKTFQGQLDEQQGITEGQGTTTWKPGNLTRGTTYYWRVRAYDGTADGPWSKVFSFTIDAEPGEVVSESNAEAKAEASQEDPADSTSQETVGDAGSGDQAVVTEPSTQDTAGGKESVSKTDSSGSQDGDETPAGCACSSTSQGGVPVAPWMLCVLGLILVGLRIRRK